jgi:outer membrane lipoprotein-sorting protein
VRESPRADGAPKILARAAAALLPFALSGCFLESTQRKLPVPRPPDSVQTVSPEELVKRLNQRWNALETLTAKVEIAASVLNSQQGVAKDYTRVPGVILMRKPAMLTVFGRVPVVGTEMFEMVSDGARFTLYVPSSSKAIEGSNTVAGKSANQFENLRPGFFLDALDVRGLNPDDFYTVFQDTETFEDVAKKHLFAMPEYILSIMHRKPDSHEEALVRVVRFHRDDLLPYEQDIYDVNENMETQVIYGTYALYGDNKYPSKITIKRPMDQIQVVLTVESVVENQKLGDEQFSVKLPPDTKIQQLQ